MTSSDRNGLPTTAKLWGVTPGLRVWVGGHDQEAKREVEHRLAGTVRPQTGRIDLAFITPQSVDEAVYFASKLRDRLAAGGAIWVVYPTAGSAEQAGGTNAAETLAQAMARCELTQSATVPVGDKYMSSCFRQRQERNRSKASS